MSMPLQINGPTEQIISEIRKARNADDCGLGTVSWELDSDCRFWAAIQVLSPKYIPLVGIAAPEVMSRVDTLQRQAGMKMQKIDWRCSPVFSLPLDVLSKNYPGSGLDILPAFDALHGPDLLEECAAQDILDSLFAAENVLKKCAGSLESLVRFGHERIPQHPTMTYLIPVGYAMLNRWGAAEEYADACLDRLQSDGHHDLSQAYEKFLGALNALRARGSGNPS